MIFHYSVHISPSFIPILSHISPFQDLPSDFCKIHFNIVFPSTPRSSKQSLSFRFKHPNPAWLCALLHTFYMPRQPNSVLLDWTNTRNVWRKVPIMILLSTQLFQTTLLISTSQYLTAQCSLRKLWYAFPKFLVFNSVRTPTIRTEFPEFLNFSGRKTRYCL